MRDITRQDVDSFLKKFPNIDYFSLAGDDNSGIGALLYLETDVGYEVKKRYRVEH